jgi:acetyl esterase/lipase
LNRLVAELVADVERRGDRVLHRDAVYAEVSGFRPLMLDIEVPVAAVPVAAVVYLHGGGFAGGTHKLCRDPLGARVAEVMGARGIAMASVGYRLSAETRFPSVVHDVKAALRWLRRHASALGIDPRRIGAWGGSAGGYLVAMLAATDGRPELEGQIGITGEDSGITAGVSWYGPANLASQPRFGPPEWNNTDPSLSPEAKLLGAPVETVPDLAALASPVTHVTSRSAPMLLVHGQRDQGVPLGQSEELVAAYRRAGASVELMVVPDGDHGFPGVDIIPMLSASAEFLGHHLEQRT